jgi:hypothetical protein
VIALSARIRRSRDEVYEGRRDVVDSEEARHRHFADDRDTELGSKAAEGAGVGAVVGVVWAQSWPVWPPQA